MYSQFRSDAAATSWLYYSFRVWFLFVATSKTNILRLCIVIVSFTSQIGTYALLLRRFGIVVLRCFSNLKHSSVPNIPKLFRSMCDLLYQAKLRSACRHDLELVLPCPYQIYMMRISKVFYLLLNKCLDDIRNQWPITKIERASPLQPERHRSNIVVARVY